MRLPASYIVEVVKYMVNDVLPLSMICFPLRIIVECVTCDRIYGVELKVITPVRCDEDMHRTYLAFEFRLSHGEASIQGVHEQLYDFDSLERHGRFSRRSRSLTTSATGLG